MRDIRDITQLICNPDKFLEEAIARDQIKNKDFYITLIHESQKARQQAFLSIFVATVIGFLAAQVLKYKLGILLPTSWLPYFKLASVSILGFAALNRLKDPKSFDGTTLIEKTNTNLFKFLYCFGFGLGIFTLSQEIPIPESVISTLEMTNMQSF